MATYDYPLIANFGVANAGRADVYVEVQSVDGTVRIARTLTGVTEWQDDNANDTGIYELVATLDDTWGPLRVMWDIDGVAGAMAAEVLQQPVALLPDAVDDLQTAATNALNAYDPPTKAELDAGLAALNDLDAAGVRSALGLAAANLDTQLAAIVADTNELQADLANGGRVDLLIDAIKAKTDQLVFTVANMVDANVQYVNDVAVAGTGATGDEWGPA